LSELLDWIENIPEVSRMFYVRTEINALKKVVTDDECEPYIRSFAYLRLAAFRERSVDSEDGVAFKQSTENQVEDLQKIFEVLASFYGSVPKEIVELDDHLHQSNQHRDALVNKLHATERALKAHRGLIDNLHLAVNREDIATLEQSLVTYNEYRHSSKHFNDLTQEYIAAEKERKLLAELILELKNI
jgi:hypothetical protein